MGLNVSSKKGNMMRSLWLLSGCCLALACADPDDGGGGGGGGTVVDAGTGENLMRGAPCAVEPTAEAPRKLFLSDMSRRLSVKI